MMQNLCASVTCENLGRCIGGAGIAAMVLSGCYKEPVLPPGYFIHSEWPRGIQRIADSELVVPPSGVGMEFAGIEDYDRVGSLVFGDLKDFQVSPIRLEFFILNAADGSVVTYPQFDLWQADLLGRGVEIDAEDERWR